MKLFSFLSFPESVFHPSFPALLQGGWPLLLSLSAGFFCWLPPLFPRTAAHSSDSFSSLLRTVRILSLSGTQKGRPDRPDGPGAAG